MKAALLLVVLAAVLCYAKCARTCVTKSPKEDVDWERVHATWYDVLETGVDIFDPDCYNLYNFTNTEKGFHVNVVLTNYKNQYRHSIQFFGIREKKGVYSFNQITKKGYEDAELASLTFVEDKNKVKEAAEHADDIFQAQYVYFTDYRSYFLVTRCTSKGLSVWAKTITPVPTREQILRIWRALVRHGIDAAFQFSRCLTEKCLEM